jgi:AraC-like DNA-binding protein
MRRWFAGTAGVWPKEIQLGGRVLMACALLRERPGTDLATVALDTGFYDHAAFAHAFVERVGFTPSRFRTEPTFFYERARPLDRC